MTSGMVIGMSIAFSIFVVVTITVFIVRHRKAKRGQGRVFQAPVVVTSATHTAPGVYPTGVQSVSVYPTAGANYQQGVYPQQPPYPVSGGMQMPMPMPQPQMNPQPAPGMTAYPPYPTAGPGMNPPSYDSAVATGPNANSSNPAYEKQSPYNPSYATGYQ